MSFIISDSLIGTTVRILSRNDQTELARGVVRALALDHGTFVLLIQSLDAREDHYRLAKGEFLQVSTFDESVHVVADET